MKQILISREQLTKIVQNVNSDIAADFATKQKDFMIGMVLTVHTQYMVHKVCDMLFGEEENNAEKTDCKKDTHAED